MIAVLQNVITPSSISQAPPYAIVHNLAMGLFFSRLTCFDYPTRTERALINSIDVLCTWLSSFLSATQQWNSEFIHVSTINESGNLDSVYGLEMASRSYLAYNWWEHGRRLVHGGITVVTSL